MKVAIATTVVAIALMLVGVFGPGLDIEAGRVFAGLGLVLLWVPISFLIRRRGDRRE